MEEKDVIQLLRHYRHDLMNHLQIVQGYLSMGKTEKVQTKIKDYMLHLQEESKLVNLNAPAFALYLLQFDSLHTNFRLTYHIDTENKDLQSVDQQLVESCQQLMENLEKASDETALYELDIQLYDAASAVVELAFTVNGRFPCTKSFVQHMENIDNFVTVHQQDNEIKCIVSVTCK